MAPSTVDVFAAFSPPGDTIVRPAIIAEVGVNHEGSLDSARRLIDAAAAGGASAVKFQSYKAATLAAADSPAYWDTEKEPTLSQRELFSRFDAFGRREYEELARHCHDSGVEFMSTPFDSDAVHYLDPLVDVFKVASADITNHPFLREIADRGKPMLLSTGASSIGEIAAALDIIEGDVPVCLMHCVLNYPTSRGDANIGMILDIRRRFPDHVAGYSDHTVPDEGLAVLTGAALLGARIIETHFTLDKTLPGNDHYHALDQVDLRRLNDRLDDLFGIIGRQEKRPLESEMPARKFARRSLVALRDLEPGHVLSETDLTAKRPGTGIGPELLTTVVGMRVRERVAGDTVLTWGMLE